VNATSALPAPETLVLRVGQRIERSGAGARAWYLATSALTGAVLYMVLAWPTAHPAMQRPTQVAGTLAPVPLVSQSISDRNEPPQSMAGTVALEAVRAVGAASKTRVLAQSNEGGTSLPANAVTLSPAAQISSATARSAEPSIGAPAMGSAVASPIAGTGQLTTGLGGAIVDARQSPDPRSQGPNRIAVPAGSPGSISASSTSTTPNRITVAPIRPQR
jgi:hypothetical protein